MRIRLSTPEATWSLSCSTHSFTLPLFLFTDAATTEIYTLSLHDALPISGRCGRQHLRSRDQVYVRGERRRRRSEEHTSELQSLRHLVCRLLLEKNKCRG